MKGAKKLAEQIATHLMTMDYGDCKAKMGDRLAIMKAKDGRERELGGRCYGNVCEVIAGHLRRHKE